MTRIKEIRDSNITFLKSSSHHAYIFPSFNMSSQFHNMENEYVEYKIIIAGALRASYMGTYVFANELTIML